MKEKSLERKINKIQTVVSVMGKTVTFLSVVLVAVCLTFIFVPTTANTYPIINALMSLLFPMIIVLLSTGFGWYYLSLSVSRLLSCEESDELDNLEDV